MSIARSDLSRSYCASLKARLLMDVVQSFPIENSLYAFEIPAGNPSASSEYLHSQIFFQNRKWTEISFDELLNQYPSGASAAITFLSDKAFRYYLPLFLSCIVNDFYKSDVLSESLIADLVPSLQAHRRKAFDIRFSSMDLDQKKCVALFLKFLAECYQDEFPCAENDFISPAIALNRYWNEFLNEM